MTLRRIINGVIRIAGRGVERIRNVVGGISANFSFKRNAECKVSIGVCFVADALRNRQIVGIHFVFKLRSDVYGFHSACIGFIKLESIRAVTYVRDRISRFVRVIGVVIYGKPRRVSIQIVRALRFGDIKVITRGKLADKVNLFIVIQFISQRIAGSIAFR